MHCHLPYPYPDELLYSVIARYLVHIGAKNAISTINHIFGHKITAQVDLPGSLHMVSERTWLVWRMTGEEIADRLTLFPYYSRYLPDVTVKRCLRNLLSNNNSNNRHSPHMQLGLIFRRVKVPRFLRFCRACKEADLSKYGETYWRRSHQLPGVLVCPEHGQPLLDSEAAMRPLSRYHFADATVSTLDVVSKYEDSSNETDVAVMLKIAKRSQEMFLRSTIKPWDTKEVKVPYRHALFERGFAQNNISSFLSQPKLRSAFVLFYGNFLLSKLNCTIELNNKKYSWLDKIFSTNQNLTFHPVEHALVQIFLESIFAKPAKPVPIGAGPWKCPNTYAKHEEQFPITRLRKIVIGSNGDLRASARCSCGFHFTFVRTTDDDPYLPVVNSISAHGPTWATEAVRLKKNGLSKWAITQKMGINYYALLRFLNKKQNTYYISPEQIIQWREEWLRLLDEVPNRSRSIAEKKNRNLYSRLWEFDRDWLYKEPTPGRHSHSPKIRVDWESRDIEWAQMLRSTASRIMQATPVKRATPTAIIRMANLSVVFCRGHLLPRCCSVLKECSESVENYRERRRLRSAAPGVHDKLRIGS